MSYATGTTHYNLPQTVGTDKRDWADTNQAFNDIDAAIYSAVSDVAAAGTAIVGLETRMTTAEGNISDNAANITSLDTRMTTAEGAITSLSGRVDDVSNDLSDMICAYNEPTATSTHAYVIGDYFRYNDVLYRATQSITIGDTIVPDTNCSTTNVSAELLQIIDNQPDPSEITQIESDISDLQTDVTALKQVGTRTVVAENVTTFKSALNQFTSTILGMSQKDLINAKIVVEAASTLIHDAVYHCVTTKNHISFESDVALYGAASATVLHSRGIALNPSTSTWEGLAIYTAFSPTSSASSVSDLMVVDYSGYTVKLIY